MTCSIDRSNRTAPAAYDSSASEANGAECAEPAPLLPSPETTSGDPTVMLAVLFVKSSQKMREGQELTVNAQEKAEDQADARRVEAMQKKAEDNFRSGALSGLADVASGVGSVTGGIAGANHSPKITAGECEGSGNITGGLLKLASASAKKSADDADGAIAHAESDAKVAKRAQDALQKQVDAASQHESKVMQLLQEIKQAQAQCERAALLRM